MENLPSDAEHELFTAAKDRIMAEETYILEGLKAAVHKGNITEEEKQEWLNEYITKRIGGIVLPTMAEVEYIDSQTLRQNAEEDTTTEASS